ncbi:hypothetical protein Bpfe_030534 [Biomphalaria pfeifferi]|uniref:Uncharacterized protein n=1 Tax=Biomphalaria pfeifferi TaxID=112525 RepID=A0AAD8EUM6_BIOPF|nr:hypothetical protein Bpfe_030534 [Biomphalaria pfeifferi]
MYKLMSTLTPCTTQEYLQYQILRTRNNMKRVKSAKQTLESCLWLLDTSLPVLLLHLLDIMRIESVSWINSIQSLRHTDHLAGHHQPSYQP